LITDKNENLLQGGEKMKNDKIIDAVKDFTKKVSIIIGNNTDDNKDNKIDTTVKINDKVVFKDKI